MSATVKKFRPYLTGLELLALIKLLKESKEELQESKELRNTLKNLEFFALKIDSGFVSSALEVERKISIEESLGLESSPTKNSIKPELLRLQAYNKWCKNPESCTQKEIDLAFTYRFENDLLTEKELDLMLFDPKQQEG